MAGSSFSGAWLAALPYNAVSRRRRRWAAERARPREAILTAKVEWGLRGVIVPLITPFKDDLSIDLRRVCARWSTTTSRR